MLFLLEFTNWGETTRCRFFIHYLTILVWESKICGHLFYYWSPNPFLSPVSGITEFLNLGESVVCLLFDYSPISELSCWSLGMWILVEFKLILSSHSRISNLLNWEENANECTHRDCLSNYVYLFMSVYHFASFLIGKAKIY